MFLLDWPVLHFLLFAWTLFTCCATNLRLASCPLLPYTATTPVLFTNLICPISQPSSRVCLWHLSDSIVVRLESVPFSLHSYCYVSIVFGRAAWRPMTTEGNEQYRCYLLTILSLITPFYPYLCSSWNESHCPTLLSSWTHCAQLQYLKLNDTFESEFDIS